MSDAVVAQGLRKWARGALDQEAGVELLIRACDGRFAQRGCPWIRSCDRPGWFWVEVTQLTEHVVACGEQRVLTVVAALIDGRPVADRAPGARGHALHLGRMGPDPSQP